MQHTATFSRVSVVSEDALRNFEALVVPVPPDACWDERPGHAPCQGANSGPRTGSANSHLCT